MMQPPSSSAEQRRWPRKAKPFYLAFSHNGIVFVPGYGLDISRSGVRILTTAKLTQTEFHARIMLGGSDFLVTAQKVWECPAPNDRQQRWLTGSRYTKIDATDRMFIEMYVQGKAYVPKSKLVVALEELRARPDNADRILPSETLRRFLQRLVAMGRLAPLKAREEPLVSYRYQGTRRRGGADMHVLQIRSKIVKKDVPHVFTTRFAFDDTASIIHVVD